MHYNKHEVAWIDNCSDNNTTIVVDAEDEDEGREVSVLHTANEKEIPVEM